MPYFRQILNESNGCISYILGCPTYQNCLIVDPHEDIEIYLRMAKGEGLRIMGVLDTHIHADHISGCRLLASETGAKIYMQRDSKVKFAFSPVVDDDEIDIGNPSVKIMHTPGHTPESISILFDRRYLLTGDTLFVGSAGRPDFTVGSVEQLYHSLMNRLMRLEDYVEIFPAHYGRSPCGRGLGNMPSSTIGYERRFNKALSAKSLEEFKSISTRNLPPPPANLEQILSKNRGEK